METATVREVWAQDLLEAADGIAVESDIFGA